MRLCFGDNKDLDLINAKFAYSQNIDGNGVIIGIIDGAVRKDHISLDGQILSEVIKKTPDFSFEIHGTHVAGIAIGKKTADLPHGVAYGAKAYALQNTSYIGKFPLENYYEYFKDKDEVKIINNSWGANIYPTAFLNIGGFGISKFTQEQTLDLILSLAENPTKQLADLARDKKKLVVFASGNEGMPGSSVNSVLPYYYESLRSWLVVGAVNSSGITKNSDGSMTISKDGFGNFGNHFKSTGLFSLMAPGVDIYSADSTNPNKSRSSDGTSMAAPFVSGAAALVAQKFNFLDGKQIADVLLSTANSKLNLPKLIVKKAHEGNKDYYGVIYIDNPVPNSDEQIKKDLAAAGYGSWEINNIFSHSYEIDAANYKPAISLSKEEVVG